jgi:DNA repair ATPase RecN
MTLQERIAKQIRQVYPWLVADWNGKEYESMTQQTKRKLNAVEAHLHSLEERYAELENRLIEHANGVTQHRAPKVKEPEAEKE